MPQPRTDGATMRGCGAPAPHEAARREGPFSGSRAPLEGRRAWPQARRPWEQETRSAPGAGDAGRGSEERDWGTGKQDDNIEMETRCRWC